MSGFVHPTALVGGPPEHRRYIHRFYRGDFAQYSPPFFPPELGEGVILHSYVTVDAGTAQPTRIGARTFCMTKCHIGHDAQVGADCEIGVGVVVSGECVIGDRVQIGGSAWLKPLVKVGDGARIGGGAVVIHDVPPGAVVAGNPARLLTSGREAERRGQVRGGWQPWKSGPEMPPRAPAGWKQAPGTISPLASATGEALTESEMQGWEEFAARAGAQS